MRLTLYNSHAVVDCDSTEEFKFASELVTFVTEQYQPWKKRFVPVVTCLLDPIKRTVPIGVVPLMIAICKQEGKPVKVENKRVRPGSEPNTEIFDLLRYPPYSFQREGATKLLKNGIGIVKAPMGSGKTFLGVMMMAAVPDINWIIFCPNESLLTQWVKEFKYQLDEDIGIIKSGEYKPKRVTAVTFSQCRSKKNKLDPLFENAGGFIIDEIHTGGAATHLEAVSKCVNAYYRCGFSATPLDRTDKKNILVVAAAGPLVYSVDSQELVDRKIVSKPKITFIRYLHDDENAAVAKLQKPAARYRARIVNNRERNKLLVKLAENVTKPAILFVLRKEHGFLLYDEIRKTGLSVAVVNQNTPQSAREEVQDKLRKGILDVAVASKVWQDGVNVPNLRTVIIGTGYESAIATLQRLGRGSRVTEDKDEFDVWDIGDEGSFGDRHTKKRDSFYTREGYETSFITPLEFEALCRQTSKT